MSVKLGHLHHFSHISAHCISSSARIIDGELLGILTAQASARMASGIRFTESAEDNSRGMLNAVGPGSEIPIHRYLIL